MEKPGVLFVCTANTARSVMAEALFRLETGNRYEVASAGLHPMPVNPLTAEVLREVGVELGDFEPRGVGEFLGRGSFRYVVAVCQAAEEACPRIWPFALHFLAWPLEDPAACLGTHEERMHTFRTIRNQIHDRVREWAEELKSVAHLRVNRK